MDLGTSQLQIKALWLAVSPTTDGQGAMTPEANSNVKLNLVEGC